MGYPKEMKIWLLLLLVTAPALGQVTVTLQSADLVAIPGSTRSVYADVEGTANLTVKWKATGGCTLASPTTTAAPQVVTAPATGSSCSYTKKAPTNTEPSFISATSCTVTAASAEDETKTASIVIPVCAPPVMLSTFPRSTVLYKNQFGIIQSNLRGSIETGVNWAITTNPENAGVLTGGSSNRHAVFSAKAAGTYVLTATSVADPSKTASTAIYVTANDLPAPTSDHTEAVDCTAVGKGKTYDVGPARKFHDLNDIAWNSLKPGDTVRIHNDDLTGTAPTTYHQHVAIAVGGTSTQPIRICGVPDAKGVKPIVDGDDATTRSDEDWAGRYLENLAVFLVYDAAHKWDTKIDDAQNILIEGLHIRNARTPYKFVKQEGGVSTPYSDFAACIRLQNGVDVMIRGNDIENCGNGIFTNAKTPEGSLVIDLTVEGNYLHGWGADKNYSMHAMYLQSLGLQLQFNYFGEALVTAKGSTVKTRAVLNFLRWNYDSQVTPTMGWLFDVVEPQAFNCYILPYDFAFVYHGGGENGDCSAPSGGVAADPLSADQVAANNEAYRADYIYGNILDELGSDVFFVHYGYDVFGKDRRSGKLYYWNNTHLSRKGSGSKGIFNPTPPDYPKFHSSEFPTIESVNNVFGASGARIFQWTVSFWSQITVDSNWINPGYALPDVNSVDTYQGGNVSPELLGCNQWGKCRHGNGHMVWERNGKPGTAASTLYVGPTPFNTETFVPTNAVRGLAAALPKAIRDQPSNMEYFPATNTIAVRHDATFLGALD
jgi:hypothetical protein